jgi:FKBP-type peptidyl-prolyl cis-trans isomerase
LGNNINFAANFLFMQRFKIAVIILFSLILCSGIGCKPKYRQADVPTQDSLPDKEAIIKANQQIVRDNIKTIRDSAVNRKWNLVQTGTGVFYHRYDEKPGPRAGKISPGDRVSLVYKLSLLDGTECYSSSNSGVKQFVVEKSEAEAGLHEVVQLLQPGDSARIVIPPHRAFGLVGDGNRIPSQATLVYEIRIIAVGQQVLN